MSTYSELIVELRDRIGRMYSSPDDGGVWIAESNTLPLVKGKGQNPTEALQDLKSKLDDKVVG